VSVLVQMLAFWGPLAERTASTSWMAVGTRLCCVPVAGHGYPFRPSFLTLAGRERVTWYCLLLMLSAKYVSGMGSVQYIERSYFDII